jgi:hypothetical protein
LYPKNKLANKPVKELLKDDGSAEDVNQDFFKPINSINTIRIAVRQVFKNYRPIGASGFSTYSAYF